MGEIFLKNGMKGEEVMVYLFVQLEVFIVVVEYGSLMKVVIKFGKDCMILCDLIDFFEDGLGYVLFLCEGCSVWLMFEGEQFQ